MSEDEYHDLQARAMRQDCYGHFVCLDDCVVSCPVWEECMAEEEREDSEDEEEIEP